jgi:hypothetical protein
MSKNKFIGSRVYKIDPMGEIGTILDMKSDFDGDIHLLVENSKGIPTTWIDRGTTDIAYISESNLTGDVFSKETNDTIGRFVAYAHVKKAEYVTADVIIFKDLRGFFRIKEVSVIGVRPDLEEKEIEL